MLGFGKKKQEQESIQPKIDKDPIDIHTIPKAFYGEQASVNAAAPVVAQQPKPVVVKPPVKPQPQKLTDPNQKHGPKHEIPIYKKKKNLMYGGAGLVLILVIAGSTWFYTKDGPGPQPVVVPPEIVVVPEIETPVKPDLEPVVPTSTPTLLVVLPLLGDTIDFDGDGLTDVEEELFTTDVADTDTDDDSFPDGVEVSNLYNPVIKAPASITTSTSISSYKSTIHKYELIYPIDWLAAPLDANKQNEVLFTSLTGEYMALNTYELEVGESFVAWFSKNNPKVAFSKLNPWENRMGQVGWYEDQQLRFYFATPEKVFVLQYNAGVRNAINFRRTLEMMAESFHFVEKSTGEAVAGLEELPELGDLPELENLFDSGKFGLEEPFAEPDLESEATTTPEVELGLEIETGEPAGGSEPEDEDQGSFIIP